MAECGVVLLLRRLNTSHGVCGHLECVAAWSVWLLGVCGRFECVAIWSVWQLGVCGRLF